MGNGKRGRIGEEQQNAWPNNNTAAEDFLGMEDVLGAKQGAIGSMDCQLDKDFFFDIS